MRSLARVAPTGDRDLQAALEQIVADRERDPRLIAASRLVLARKPAEHAAKDVPMPAPAALR